jgi:arylsulfatase A
MTPGRPTVLPLLHNTTVVEQPVDLNTLDERYAAKAVQFISQQAKAQNPFVLYFACNHVHIPDYAGPEYCNKTKRGRFGDAMTEMDASIGKVTHGLKEAGVDDNTIMFFTSDNGPWIIQKLQGGSAGPLFEGKQTTWEGGIREPAIVRWPGRIPAGSVSMEVAATYDIFATAVALAGAALPADRAIDGKDLSGVLFHGEGGPHECLFHYKGVPSTGLPPAADDPQPGLWAVRCGAYKAHFASQCSIMHQLGDSRCSSEFAGEDERIGGEPNGLSKPIIHNPPLLYNVEHDLGEQYPIAHDSTEYQTAMAQILKAKKEHEATLAPVPNQIALGGSDDVKVCCDPQSQQKHPSYLNCTCNPENFDDVFVCTPVQAPTLLQRTNAIAVAV